LDLVVPSLHLKHWTLKDFAPDEMTVANILAMDARDWIAIDAPGDTYLALHAAGRIPHPFAAENETLCAWVKDREWWWRSSIDAAPGGTDERVVLVFEGLDTFATVWVNGVEVGATSNMFLEHRMDIGAVLRGNSENEVLVRFTPPAIKVQNKQMATWPIIADPITESKRNFIRKAQFGWGWDWGPRLPSVGIWRAVRIEREYIAALADVRFETLEIGAVARVAVTVALDAFRSAPLEASITLTDPAGRVTAATVIDPTRESRVEFLIENPQYWWSSDLGDAALYTLAVALSSNGILLTQRQRRVGIRTVVLDTSADPEEEGCDFFRFVLNGVPVFARGANWIPASSFLGSLSPSHYADLLERAAAANMNMIRVWGGGIYEHDAFYDECDRRGLLVWQDFMFACAPYPEHEPAFVASVREEIAYQILRLRNHPCLVLWCGNNEGDAVQAFMNRLTGKQDPFLGDLFIHDIIPNALKNLDPGRPYWPGSPYGGPSHNSMRAGDVHSWTVWHGLPPTPDAVPIGDFDHSPEGVAYTRYAEDKGRFVSEFGIQAAPALATLERWMRPESMELGSDGFLNRIKDHPKDKVNAMLLPVTGLPQTLAQYVRFTQIVQAEGLKFGIEHYRRRRPHCSGTLVWQFNDCWPGITWSLVDHDGVAKPSWYAVRRAYAPVMASFKPLDRGLVELWVVNDTLASMPVSARIELETLRGEVLSAVEIKETVPAATSMRIWRDHPAGKADRVLHVRSPQFDVNRHFFAALKDVPFEPRSLHMAIEQIDLHTLNVLFTALHYVCGATLVCPHAGTGFSDNFFDLCAGQSRSIIVKNPITELRPKDVTSRYALFEECGN
jgi:beta-mannosidase